MKNYLKKNGFYLLRRYQINGSFSLILGSGKIYKYPGKPAVVLTIFNFSDINNLIIPFFDKNPLLGVKLIDYLDWCKVAKLMIEGSHLTKEGVNLIREIQSGMNKGRDNNNI
jgi:hypothetical protein